MHIFARTGRRSARGCKAGLIWTPRTAPQESIFGRRVCRRHITSERSTGDRLAVLIDADNASYRHIPGVLAEVANYGTASVKRMYGDFTSRGLQVWKDTMLKHSILPIQQFAYTKGKNSTDGAMMIDAMDLLYTGRFSGFCIVSSDSDFTRLAARIREQGISVYGFGRRRTADAFVAACNEFIYFDALPEQPADPDAPPADAIILKRDEPEDVAMESHELEGNRSYDSITSSTHKSFSHSNSSMDVQPQPLMSARESQRKEQSHRPAYPLLQGQLAPSPRRPIDKPTLDRLRNAISGLGNESDEAFVDISDLGAHLVKIAPDLKAKNYGYSRLLSFVEASGLVQVKKTHKGRGGVLHYMVRLKHESSES